MLSAIRRLGVGAILLLLAGPLPADEFRIETKVYLEDADEPAQENLTLFQRGVVYDFLDSSPREVTIYEPTSGQFTLLDVDRKFKTSIDRKTLSAFVAAVKVQAEKAQPLIREAADPEFEVAFNERLKEVSLQGDLIQYAAAGQAFPADQGHIARHYREFADMYARLNATRPGALPPFARLQLNSQLASRGLYPTRVELTLVRGRLLAGGKTVARSEHSVGWRLLRADQKRIDAASRQRVQFKSVSFGKYRRLGEYE